RNVPDFRAQTASSLHRPNGHRSAAVEPRDEGQKRAEAVSIPSRSAYALRMTRTPTTIVALGCGAQCGHQETPTMQRPLCCIDPLNPPVESGHSMEMRYCAPASCPCPELPHTNGFALLISSSVTLMPLI
ncbi:hypothetical protein VSR34_20475, partial [Paraburkholderia sp. JHI2823]|uniref:hypothetical protein n=1 Tax=Paraburkholderia sp. JHI2823 TaxID=3112960 RepID=UPI00317CB821